MKYLLLGLPALAATPNPNPLPNFKDYQQVKLTKDQEDLTALEKRFNCPLTKRPWQYRPYGCHNKHHLIKNNLKFENIKWFEPDSDECQFFDICMRSCKSVRSPQNFCLNPENNIIEKAGTKSWFLGKECRISR